MGHPIFKVNTTSPFAVLSKNGKKYEKWLSTSGGLIVFLWEMEIIMCSKGHFVSFLQVSEVAWCRSNALICSAQNVCLEPPSYWPPVHERNNYLSRTHHGNARKQLTDSTNVSQAIESFVGVARSCLDVSRLG